MIFLPNNNIHIYLYIYLSIYYVHSYKHICRYRYKLIYFQLLRSDMTNLDLLDFPEYLIQTFSPNLVISNKL